MENLFLSVVQMSLLGSYIIGVVLVLRLLLRRAPKFLSYLLWAVVFIRLIVPISIESPISLVPGALNAGITSETAGASMQTGDSSAILSDATGSWQDKGNGQGTYKDSDTVGAGNAAGLGDAAGHTDAVTVSGDNRLGLISSVLAIAKNHSVLFLLLCSIWLLGVIVIGSYNLILTARLRRRLADAMKIGEGIYVSSLIQTPFVFGLYRPRIYLPNTIGEEEQEYIICHEQVHIRRYDYLIKSLAFAITCVHWFNPLVWLAYVLMGHDMEMSCDEKVLLRYGSQIKKEYSGSLLAMAVRADSVRGPMIAFGKNDVKQRVSHVLRFKKTRVASVVVLVAICIVVMAMLLTNQSKNNSGLLASETESVQVSTETEAATEMITGTETPIDSYAEKDAASESQAMEALNKLELDESELREKLEAEKASQQELELAVGELYYQYAQNVPEVNNADMFYELYQNIADFDGSGMDFIDNGYGEKLNEAALLSSSNEYKALFNATDAPMYLFHLYGGTCYTHVTERDPNLPDTSGDRQVDYEFADGSATIRFIMKQPYGENGIWLVENILPVDKTQEDEEQNMDATGTDTNDDTTYIEETQEDEQEEAKEAKDALKKAYEEELNSATAAE